MKWCRIAVTSSEEVFAEFLRNLGSESLKSFCNIYWTRLLNSCNIQRIIGSKISAKSNYEREVAEFSATSSVLLVAEFLWHTVSELSQNFYDIQCVRICTISAKPSKWKVIEFLQNLMNGWLQNFCDGTNGRRISATSSIRMVAEFLRHPVYEWLKKFCDIQRIRLCRLSAKSSEGEVAEFLRHPVYEWLQNNCDMQSPNGGRIFSNIHWPRGCRIFAISVLSTKQKLLRSNLFNKSFQGETIDLSENLLF